MLGPAPEAAAEIFGDRMDQATEYAELLATDGVVRGLIGPREAPRLWDRHVLNCAVLAEAVPAQASVCDIGSGAGLPGIVLAILRPDAQVTLIEPLLRRTTFLQEAVDSLALANVEVARGRAEEMHRARAHSFDVVTSRAVAPLDRLAKWSMPLVAPTGAMVALKGSAATEEVAAARTLLRRMGCAEPEILELGPVGSVHRTNAVRVAWADPAKVGLRGSGSTRSRRRC